MGLRQWLQQIQKGWEHSLWWEVVEQFLDACREALIRGDLDALREWHRWLEEDGDGLFSLSWLRDVAPWQRAWMGVFLEAALAVAGEANWTDRSYPRGLPGKIRKCWNGVRQGDWPDFAEDAFWHDLVRFLLNARPPVQRRVRVPFPVVFRGASGTGILLQFELEALGWELPGRGIFWDPARVLPWPMRADFVSALQEAARAAETEGWVRVRVMPVDPRDRYTGALLWLEGPSAGGAMYVGLRALRQGLWPEPGMAFSFAVGPAGSPAAVGEIGRKARACRDYGFSRLMVAGAEAEEEAEGAALVRVASLREAEEGALGLAEAVRDYLNQLRKRMDQTPWRDRHGGRIPVSRVAVPIRVLKKVVRRKPVGAEEERAGPARRPAWVDPARAPYYEEPVEYETKEVVAWEREMREVRRGVILGPPGGGKTFLTQWTVLQLIAEAEEKLAAGWPLSEIPLPIHMDLRRAVEWAAGSSPEAPLVGALTDVGVAPDRARPLAGLFRENPQAWLVLDALDQVPQDGWSGLRDWLGQIEAWGCRVVLTCRTARYDRHALPWQKAPEYELAPLEPDGIRTLFERWFGDGRGRDLWERVRANPPLMEACRSPLVASMACLVHEEKSLPAGFRRGDLYGEALKLLIRWGWNRLGRAGTGTDLARRLVVLQEMAWRLFQKRPEVNDFGLTEVEAALGQAVERYKSLGVDELMNEFQAAGILQDAGWERGEMRLAFLHRTFLEYLAGMALARRVEEDWGRWQELVDRKAWHPAWREVIVFMGWKLGEDALDRLMALLADEGRDDYFRHRLALALWVLAERA